MDKCWGPSLRWLDTVRIIFGANHMEVSRTNRTLDMYADLQLWVYGTIVEKKTSTTASFDTHL